MDEEQQAKGRRLVRLVFLAGYALITLSFPVCGVALVWFALLEIWHALSPAGTESARKRFNTILDSIGLLTIATASLELGRRSSKRRPIRARPRECAASSRAS